MMRVLIIGTSGQLATELRRTSLAREVSLFPAEKVDLSEPPQVRAFLDRHRPDLVINAAAYTAVDRAEAEPHLAHAVNTEGPRLVADWCAQTGATLFHVSTDYVFDGTASVPYRESDPVAPLGVYGRTKAEGEVAVRAVLERHVILRTSWVFSPVGHNFAKTIARLANERDVLRIVSDQRGRPTAAGALARAIVELTRQLASRGRLPWGTFHFANHGETSWHGFASAIVDELATHTGRHPVVEPISTAEYPTPVQRPAYSVLDTSRFEAAFGVRPGLWSEELPGIVASIVKPL